MQISKTNNSTAKTQSRGESPFCKQTNKKQFSQKDTEIMILFNINHFSSIPQYWIGCVRVAFFYVQLYPNFHHNL